MEFGPQQIGKLLIAIGATIILLGLLFLLLGQLGLFKLPGDLQFGSKNWWVFIPITSCIIISIVLTLILLLISYLRR
jgi:heme/copper-type cytochrome/quinol oxidase subunit 2